MFIFPLLISHTSNLFKQINTFICSFSMYFLNFLIFTIFSFCNFYIFFENLLHLHNISPIVFLFLCRILNVYRDSVFRLDSFIICRFSLCIILNLFMYHRIKMFKVNDKGILVHHSSFDATVIFSGRFKCGSRLWEALLRCVHSATSEMSSG